MIDAALSHLAFQLNQQFKNNFRIIEDVVVVSNLLELDGSVAPGANNKLVLTLVNNTVAPPTLNCSPAASSFSRVRIPFVRRDNDFFRIPHVPTPTHGRHSVSR